MTGRDPVTPEMRLAVLQRDRGCVAVALGADPMTCLGRLTLDHVKDKPKIGDVILKRGKGRKHRYRAPSDLDHLVAICERHHLGGWATAHRPELRAYLRGVA